MTKNVVKSATQSVEKKRTPELAKVLLLFQKLKGN